MPDWPSHVRPRLASLHLSPPREEEIVEELSQHLEDRWRELRAGGASDDEATRLALAEFRDGNLLARHLAALRQARTAPPATPGAPARALRGDLWRDVRYAARMLRKQRGFACTAIVTLALAVGATTAIFAVVDGVLLRPLPFPDAERLVQVVRVHPEGIGTWVSVVKFMRWRAESPEVLDAMAAYGDQGAGFNLAGSQEPERLIGAYVSARFFDVIGVPPVIGRAFQEHEDLPGGSRVVVLSHALWQVRFGGRPDIVGAAVTLNGELYTVIGVMPDGFRFPDVAQLWTLFRFDPASRDRGHNFKVVGRLKPDATVDQAHAAMQIAASRIRRSLPDVMDENESVGVRPLRDELYGDLRQPLLILLASVGFVLLIACVNVANLQLAQAAGRHHELAIRTALGASRSALVRQLLVESLLLAACGGLAGVALAYGLVPLLLSLSPAALPYAERIGVDWRVLGFGLVLSVAASLAFGLLPASQSARPHIDAVLRAGGVRLVPRTNGWLRRTLVAGEVALALVLTIGAFLLAKSLIGLHSTDPGFAVENVLTLKLALPEGKYGNGKALARLQEELEERLAAIPGVRAGSLAHTLPFEIGSDLPFTIEGRYVPGTDTGVGFGEYRPVGRAYFDALRIPVHRGRAFDARDGRRTLPVAVINETAARRFWPGEDAIGRRITLGQPFVPDLADPAPREIVGIVADVREEGLGAEPPPLVYVPISQLNEAYAALGTRLLPFAVIVRGDTTAATLTRSVRQAIWSIDPQQPIADVRLMRDMVARSLAPQTFNTILLGGLATLALVLAAVGLYGLISHLVGQQTREIGLRMALGAGRSTVLGLFLRQALSLVAAGTAIGLVGALVVTRVLRGLLTGISTTDPWVFALAPALLFGVALLAALRPAVRAAAVDPALALRGE